MMETFFHVFTSVEYFNISFISYDSFYLTKYIYPIFVMKWKKEVDEYILKEASKRQV